MDNYLDGFERKEVTLNATDKVIKGKTVELVDSFLVDSSADGHLFAGVCTHAYKNSASVLLKGYTKVTYTGTAPECGYVKLTADGNGGVKVDENGRYVLVTDVDNENGICGIIL